MEENFSQFSDNLKLTSNQREDAKKKYEGVCECLDKHYYDSEYNENHKLLFGSYKTRTNIRPIIPEQDVDVLFKISEELYNSYKNNPERLLQDMRSALKQKYATTDKISAWGKVILIQFSDGTHNVEVLPAIENNDSTFLIPNTESGGSWEYIDPRSQINSSSFASDKSRV